MKWHLFKCKLAEMKWKFFNCRNFTEGEKEALKWHKNGYLYRVWLSKKRDSKNCKIGCPVPEEEIEKTILEHNRFWMWCILEVDHWKKVYKRDKYFDPFLYRFNNHAYIKRP